MSFLPITIKMVFFNKKENKRIAENVSLILKESRFRFNIQKEAWNDLDKKTFYLISFISIFVGFIVVNDLFKLFEYEIPFIFKLSLLIGLFLLAIATHNLIRIVLPTEFKTSASINDLLDNYSKNKLFNAKFHLINIYERMNRDNKNILFRRAFIFKLSLYYLLLGLLFILFSKSFYIVKFLLSF